MNRLILIASLAALNYVSQTAAAQVVPAVPSAVVDTTGLLIKPSFVDLDAPIESRGSHRICFHCQWPFFKGGQEEFSKFLSQNFHWPDNLPRSAHGRVLVSFTVDEQGKVRDPTITTGFHPLADAEALRLVRLLDGYYIPAKDNQNRPLAMKQTLPIIFGEPLSGKSKR